MSELTARPPKSSRAAYEHLAEGGYIVFVGAGELPLRLLPEQSRALTESGFLWAMKLAESVSADEFQAAGKIIRAYSGPAGVFSTSEQEQLIKQLTRLYRFDDYVAVSHFLRSNPFLTRLLSEAHEEVERYFGPDIQVALEVFTDPEAESDQQLFALIQTNLPLQEELDLLDQLYEDWWLDTLPAARCKLTIDVE